MEQKVNRELEEANKKMKQDRLSEALMDIRSKIESSLSLRERFLWQLGICQLLIKAKKTALAIPYIERILSTIERYNLEEWEPDLAVRALEISLRGCLLYTSPSPRD